METSNSPSFKGNHISNPWICSSAAQQPTWILQTCRGQVVSRYHGKTLLISCGKQEAFQISAISNCTTQDFIKNTCAVCPLRLKLTRFAANRCSYSSLCLQRKLLLFPCFHCPLTPSWAGKTTALELRAEQQQVKKEEEKEAEGTRRRAVKSPGLLA